MIKVFSYFDEWINAYFNFHRSLEYPYIWIIPLLEILCFSIIFYYINYFTPRKEQEE